MGIADPRELAARPWVIECRQLHNMAEFVAIQQHRFNADCTDCRRSEPGLAKVKPETLHALDLSGFH
ncbi:hypothetical protein D3C71_2067390 [compost metagenome]